MLHFNVNEIRIKNKKISFFYNQFQSGNKDENDNEVIFDNSKYILK